MRRVSSRVAAAVKKIVKTVKHTVSRAICRTGNGVYAELETYWECPICGYEPEIRLPKCPKCGQHQIRLVSRIDKNKLSKAALRELERLSITEQENAWTQE